MECDVNIFWLTAADVISKLSAVLGCQLFLFFLYYVWIAVWQSRHGRGSIFCDPTQPNPVADGPNPTHETSLQNNPTH